MGKAHEASHSRVHVPAGQGQAFRLSAGTTFRVIDREGQQVADLFCFCAGNPSEYLSASHTRVGHDATVRREAHPDRYRGVVSRS